MTNPAIEPRLITQLFDGELSDADVAVLGDALTSSEAAQQQYLDAIYLREGMRLWAHSRGAANELQVINSAVTLASAEPSGNVIRGQQFTQSEGHESRGARGESSLGSADRLHRTPWRFAAAVAALLLFSTGLYFGQPWPFHDAARFDRLTGGDLTLSEEDYALSESDSVVARLTAATSDVRWTRGKVPSDFLMRFRPGDIIGIESGTAQVEFSGGAHLVLSSPAALQFTGASSARLIQGNVTGRAESTNFALVTPSATVVDIGTEFGVGVGSDGTNVSVFEGELQVHSLVENGEGASMRRVREGMSMRIDSEGTQVVLANTGNAYRRDLLRPTAPIEDEGAISLLDLICGHDYSQARIAGSIDPSSGYWGKPPWLGTDRPMRQRGDTQFTATPWNRMVDGVFIPRSNAREMQIDSDGHMVHLPPNQGTSWGPIWARRLSGMDRDKTYLSANDNDHWGSGTLEAVHRRLLTARDGVLGLHANVGITFDLNSVREVRGTEMAEFKALLLNLGARGGRDGDLEQSLADLRVFVDGKLKYSRLEFSADDGEAEVVVSIGPDDRFLTLVATDSDGDPRLDHVVLVDPVLRPQEKAPLADHTAPRSLYAAKRALDQPPLSL